MFKRTRRRLVIINSLVFFFILVVLGAALDVNMEHHLYHQADESMLQSEKIMQTIDLADMVREPHPNPEMDFRMIYLFWNAQGELITQSPRQSFSADNVKAFQGNVSNRELSTVQSSNRRYRTLVIPAASLVTREGKSSKMNPTVSSIAAVELVRNLEAEDNMVASLRVNILFGITLGGLIALLAGYFLAGRALVPIRRSWDKQQQFVADASHELRTPTAVIQAQSEWLFRYPDHTIEEESRHIAIILKESKRMGKLVDDLLTLARTDSNQLQLRLTSLSLDTMLYEMVEQFKYLAETKDIIIVGDIQGPLTIVGDEERIRQLLVILLDNALKFTPQGGTIRVRCEKQAHAVHLVIEDTGTGIPAEEIPLLFERFYRGDKARTRSEGGTGLGLSIAHWIVTAHQGEIQIQSEVGRGTEVRVTLPLRKKSVDAMMLTSS